MSDAEKIDLPSLLNEYWSDSSEGFQKAITALSALKKESNHPHQLARIDEVFRVLHTLKSSSAMLEFSDVFELSHTIEGLLDRIRKETIPVSRPVIDLLISSVDALEAMVRGRVFGETSTQMQETSQSETKPPESKLPEIKPIDTIRVRVNLLDSLFNQAGELIITKNRIDNLIGTSASKALRNELSAMNRMIQTVRDAVGEARLVPVEVTFDKFPRMVRALARDQKKEIDFSMEGRDVELDKAVLDRIGEPLIHLIRNAVGHGIESPDERERAGKKRAGTIKLIARRTENAILIDVEDDGAGIDFQRVKEVAIKKGFVGETQAASLRDREILNLMFRPGFSTIERATGLFGRGVGLSVVKTVAKEMGGAVEIETWKGKGSRFTLSVPVTTAIIQTVMVEVRGCVFSIPSELVWKTLRVGVESIHEGGGGAVLVHEHELIPLVKLSEALAISGEKRTENSVVVIVRRKTRVIGLCVDEIVGQMDSIVKPFDPVARQFRGFSGGTVLGDGRVALLLDIPALFNFDTLQEESVA